MRVVQRLRHPLHDAQGLWPGQGRARGHEGGKRPAFQVLERDEQRARLGVAADVVDDHDVGVGQAGRDLGLREEPPLELLALVGRHRERELDGLEGDGPPEDGVEGLVDDAHHPAPDLAPDVVAPDGRGRTQLPDQHRLH
jgi:hypothetical protein